MIQAGMLSHTSCRMCANQARSRITPTFLNGVRGSGQKMNAVAAAVTMATSSRFVIVALRAIGFCDELLSSHAITDGTIIGVIIGGCVM